MILRTGVTTESPKWQHFGKLQVDRFRRTLASPATTESGFGHRLHCFDRPFNDHVPDMQQQFGGLGIRFRYPDEWTLSEELGDDEATITVSSPESAFWSVTVLRHRPDPEEVLQASVEVFEDEYAERDVSMHEVTLANRPASAADIDFVCLELTNSAYLRSFRTGQFTVLVLYQLTDEDVDEQQSTLEAISDSLICESDIEAAW